MVKLVSKLRTDSKAGAIKDNMDGIKTLGDMFRNIYERHVREKETAVKGTTSKHHKSSGTLGVKQIYLQRAKIVKQQLQLTKECKT